MGKVSPALQVPKCLSTYTPVEARFPLSASIIDL